MNDVVISEPARTAVGKFGGALSSVSESDLASGLLRALAERAGLGEGDVGRVRSWDIDPGDQRLNPNGSSIGLGHPVGGTGARILTTMAHEAQRREARYVLEPVCIGGAQRIAAVFEAVQ